MKEPKWTEKWGVSLTSGEEFHVTEKLLKLPFQETPPKTVCTFSIDQGSLRFQHLDTDRKVTHNGKPEKECRPNVGDKLLIGETIQVEVLAAPIAKSLVTVKEEDSLGPVIRSEISIPEADGPTLTMTMTATPMEVESLSPFSAGTRSIQIPEPSIEMVRPDLSPRTRPLLPPEPKVELADSPHGHIDRSIEERMAGMTESELDGVRPFYPEKAKLSSKSVSFAEKIMNTISKVIHKDDIHPPSEKFPLEKDPTNTGYKLEHPPEPKKRKNEFKPTPPVSRQSGKKWVPETKEKSSSLGGRALVFLVAATGALMLAVGVFQVMNRVEKGSAVVHSEKAKPTELTEHVEHKPYERGIPVDLIEMQVRKMQRKR